MSPPNPPRIPSSKPPPPPPQTRPLGGGQPPGPRGTTRPPHGMTGPQGGQPRGNKGPRGGQPPPVEKVFLHSNSFNPDVLRSYFRSRSFLDAKVDVLDNRGDEGQGFILFQFHLKVIPITSSPQVLTSSWATGSFSPWPPRCWQTSSRGVRTRRPSSTFQTSKWTSWRRSGLENLWRKCIKIFFFAFNASFSPGFRHDLRGQGHLGLRGRAHGRAELARHHPGDDDVDGVVATVDAGRVQVGVEGVVVVVVLEASSSSS